MSVLVELSNSWHFIIGSPAVTLTEMGPDLSAKKDTELAYVRGVS